MPVRATKRGAERTPFPPDARYDVVICGASFAGLRGRARAARLARAGLGARSLRDRRAPDVGLLRTHANGWRTSGWRPRSGRPSTRWSCTRWAPHALAAAATRSPPSTTGELCALLWEQCGDAEFETAKVDGRTGNTVHTDRGDVDRAADRRRPRLAPGALQRASRSSRPRRRSRAGWRSIRTVRHPDLQLWVDPRYVPSGYGWSFPAGDELRIGIGSYDPRFHVKEPDRTAWRIDEGADTVRYQGNWIPHRIRAGHRGRRVLRRRLGRPLHPDERRGDPHRVLLRHRLRARAGARCWRASSTAGAGAGRLPRVRARARVEVRVDAGSTSVRCVTSTGDRSMLWQD